MSLYQHLSLNSLSLLVSYDHVMFFKYGVTIPLCIPEAYLVCIYIYKIGKNLSTYPSSDNVRVQSSIG